MRDCQGHEGREGLALPLWRKMSSKWEEHQGKSMAEVALECLRNNKEAKMAVIEDGRGSGVGREVGRNRSPDPTRK